MYNGLNQKQKEINKQTMTNKPIQKSLEALKKEMLLNILSVKGVIYTYYENKLSHREADNSLETFLGIEGTIKKQ